jgi:hypothetical protein
MEVIDAIKYGMLQWIAGQQGEHTTVHALTAGSLRGPDISLTMAFTDQFHTIGWYHLLMGRLSIKWGKAVALYHKAPPGSNISKTWTTQAVSQLWKFTRSLWAYRNTVVHGATDKEIANKIRTEITTKVTSLYTEYQANHNIILPKHKYLFSSRTLEQRLQLDIDSLHCWLRSVDDAKQALKHHDTQLRLTSARFFEPFYALGRTRSTTQASSSTESDYPSSSTDEDNEDNSITTYTSTMNTSITTFTSSSNNTFTDTQTMASTPTTPTPMSHAGAGAPGRGGPGATAAHRRETDRGGGEGWYK